MKDVGERTILEEGGVRITNLRAVIGSKTYAMANITSVNMTTRNDRGGYAPLIIMVLGAFMGFCLFANSLDQGTVNWILFFASGITVLGSFALGVFIYVNSKPQYFLKLGSSSGEMNILQSYDPNQIRRIVDAVNEAIISRG